MYDIKKILLCARVNFKKWLITPRMYVILAIIIVFEYYTFSDVSKISAYLGVNSTPWVFPFFLTNPTMFIIIGSLTTLLYCNAPFADKHMPFLIIRTGRRNWIIGQLLYIYLSSFMYTCCYLLLSIIMLVPRIQLSTDWGSLLHTTSTAYADILERTGAKIAFMPHSQLLDLFTPLQATALSFFLLWLVTAFIGVLICCFNIVIGKMSGITMAGIFTSIAYFSAYLGAFSIGLWIYYLSPISWSSLSFLDVINSGKIPTPTYAIICLLSVIILQSIISIIVFCRKDLEIQKGDF
jgi:hypothetical protein